MASIRRIFLPTEHVSTASSAAWGDAAIALDADEAHYARQVLRLADGQALTALDGQGRAAAAILQHSGKQAAAVRLQAPLAALPALAEQRPLRLLVPQAKGERSDWLLEKLTELAVDELVWVLCARSVVLPGGASKAARLLRLARAACRQARHGRVPRLCGPMPLAEALALPDERPGARAWAADVAAHGEVLPPLWQAALTAPANTVLIGPEGGLTEDELQAATGRGYTRVNLGPHVLRLETAAVAAAVACTLNEASQHHVAT